MILIKPSFEIMSDVSPLSVLKRIEQAGRTCYKSKASDDTCVPFVKMLIKRGHESVLEHESISVRVVCDRGVSHELVRHRIASFSQESTRYCNYSGEITFIIPPWVDVETGEYDVSTVKKFANSFNTKYSDWAWLSACKQSETSYAALLTQGWTPQQARTTLNNSVKTEIVITQNLRQWRHFFKVRALGLTGEPHPQMLEIAVPMLANFKSLLPVIFDDLEGEKK